VHCRCSASLGSEAIGQLGFCAIASAKPLAETLSGTVEVDETYVGGKPRKEAGAPKAKSWNKENSGRGACRARWQSGVRKIDRVDGATLKGAIRENVDPKARIMTDEWAAYRTSATSSRAA
jgi:L-alanine-DL-glutamate epimerase-like enolase superfamily enzyme